MKWALQSGLLQALLDFIKGDRFNMLHSDAFINSLRGRSKDLGMVEPLLCHATHMNEFSDANRLEKLLRNVVAEASGIGKGNLQLIVCVMARNQKGSRVQVFQMGNRDRSVW